MAEEERQPVPSDQQPLEAYARCLEQRLKFAAFGLLFTAGALIWSERKRHSQAVKPRDNGPLDLRVRRLAVVDENGTERIVLAAPLSDPQMMGEILPRRVPATGLQINDAVGNERGGVVMLEDGSFVVGIDDEQGHERAHLYYLPERGVGLLLQGAEGHGQISLTLPAKGDQAGKPTLEMIDPAGNITAKVPASKEGEKE
jgi:hypothetical protein